MAAKPCLHPLHLWNIRVYIYIYLFIYIYRCFHAFVFSFCCCFLTTFFLSFCCCRVPALPELPSHYLRHHIFHCPHCHLKKSNIVQPFCTPTPSSLSPSTSGSPSPSSRSKKKHAHIQRASCYHILFTLKRHACSMNLETAI